MNQHEVYALVFLAGVVVGALCVTVLAVIGLSNIGPRF